MSENHSARQPADVRLNFLLQHTSAAIFCIDAATHITTFVSDSITAITGYTPEEVLTIPTFWTDHVHPDDQQRILAGHAEFFVKREHVQEYRLRQRDGAYRWVRQGVTLICSAEGNPVEIIGYLIDIHDRVQAETALAASRDELRRANAELAKAVRAKDEFLASISHELRTPLTGVLGFAEALSEQTYGPLNDRQLRTVRSIEKSGRHLLELINDILDLAKLEAGQTELATTTFLLDEVCRSSLDMTRQLAQAKDHHITYSITPAYLLITSDPRRIKQVLVNLLGNAIKFTPNGGEIDLTVTGDPAAHLVQLRVTDNGIGIDAKDLDRLFEPFVQLQGGLTRSYNGTGLGLALVKRFVELIGGEVGVISTLGAGSCFTVTLPWRQEDMAIFAAAPAHAGRAPVDGAPPALRKKPLVLIAEANETLAVSYVEQLGCDGYPASVAHTGREAIEMAQALQPGLLLINVQISGVDGVEAIRRIRASRQPTVAQTPILAISPVATQAELERSLGAGANALLAAPLRLDELIAAVETYLKPRI